ncbi:MAG TPA: sigma-70 family RNA polymerase sigma factor [Candidatus Dormibacteraeota bacterium]
MSSASMVVEAPEGASPGGPARGSALVDPALVLRAQAGDPDALTELAEQVRPTAQRFASRFLNDPTRGEDVAQVALMKAFSRLGDVRAPAAFPAWLMRIVRNECLNELSRQKHAQVPMSLLAGEGTQIQAPAGGDGDPEEALLRSQLQDLVRKVAATLPHHHRQALVMRALEDRTYEEISQALDVPVSVARVWYFRARRRFRASFVTMMVARRGVPALCQEMGEAIAEMIEGTLAAADRPRLQGHLDTCTVCRQTEDELRNTAFRTPTRAMLLGLGLLRLGWRLPARVRAGAARAPAAAAKVAVTGAGGAVLATAMGAAAPPAAPAGSTLPAAPTGTGPVGTVPPAGAVVNSPAPLAGATATPAPPTLPGLPAVLGAAPVGSLLEQLRGATTKVGGAVVAPLPTPPAGLGSVTSAVGGLAHPPTAGPAPALP